jgi:hypothetical protein
MGIHSKYQTHFLDKGNDEGIDNSDTHIIKKYPDLSSPAANKSIE